jgi:CheY-like chemotaxis protein
MSKQSVKILLVEDNLADARLLADMFNEQDSHNIELTRVETMREAEESLAEHTFDIMLIDLGLPDARGAEAVRRARTAAPWSS